MNGVSRFKKGACVSILVLILCFLFVWGISIIRIEILTAKYGGQFEDEYKQCNMIDGIEYLKVMKYSKIGAKVYYVSTNKSTADLLTFERDKGKWVMKKWETIWSKTGSASEYIWPYIRLIS